MEPSDLNHHAVFRADRRDNQFSSQQRRRIQSAKVDPLYKHNAIH